VSDATGKNVRLIRLVHIFLLSELSLVVSDLSIVARYRMPDSELITNAKMTDSGGTNSQVAAPQAVVVPLTRDTIFLVVTVNRDEASLASMRALCGDLPKLLRAVGFREPTGNLSCVIGFGSDIWDPLFG
jgi:Dyp-type peroxidase family